jgi:hypothetical protein
MDWCKSVEAISSTIRNVKTIPLVPKLREDGPVSLSKQLIEISTWFSKVYEKNSLGVVRVWKNSLKYWGKPMKTLDLGFSDIYTVALPCSLIPGSPLVPVKFKNSLSHTTIRGLDSEASYGLARTLLDLLQCDFATDANSDELFSAEPAVQIASGKDFTQIIICGGSNMSKIIPLLTEKGFEVIDLTTPGWTPTEKNIQTMKESLLSIPNKAESAVFLDLLGNVAFRQMQLDGTMALPYKSDGKYHIEGKVHVCSSQSLSNLIQAVKPILDSLEGPFVFSSPFPRFPFNGCCLSQEHCIGTDTEEYVKSLLQETLSLRGVC